MLERQFLASDHNESEFKFEKNIAIKIQPKTIVSETKMKIIEILQVSFLRRLNLKVFQLFALKIKSICSISIWTCVYPQFYQFLKSITKQTQ